MRFQEMLVEIKHLPIKERLLLLEELSRSVREELYYPPGPETAPTAELSTVEASGPVTSPVRLALGDSEFNETRYLEAAVAHH